MMKSILTFVILFSAMTLALAAGFQEIKSHDIPKEDLQNPIGPMNPDKRIHLVVELPIRNKPERDQLLKDLYDPKSPDYGHYLTPQEFTDRFGPTQADYDTVIAFFKNQGFKVTTSPSRALLDIDGTVQMIEDTFHTTLKLYKHPTENRNFYAPDGNISVDLDIPLSGVAGLDNFTRFHPGDFGAHHNLN
jgi:subtilase family serine protease